MNNKVVFVYNANSGVKNIILDSVHKLVSPQTYKCNLCAITHGLFSAKKEWKSFVDEHKDQLVFLHKDEFENLYKSKFHQYKLSYPIVLLMQQDFTEILITPQELNKLKTLPQLINLLTKRLKTTV